MVDVVTDLIGKRMDSVVGIVAIAAVVDKGGGGCLTGGDAKGSVVAIAVAVIVGVPDGDDDVIEG